MHPVRLPALVLLALAAVVPAARAQDTSTAAAIELLRSDVRGAKAEIVGQALTLSDADAKIFWPLYRQYEVEASKLGDERVALIREFASNYETMTDAQAVNLSQRSMDLEARRLKLRRDQFAIFQKKLPGRTVARFFQLDAYLSKVIDVKVAREFPLVQH